MKVIQRQTMSPAEFLEWEVGQDCKWEFDGFQPVVRAGGSDAHAAIQVNLLAALVPRLRGSPCRTIGSELKVGAGSSYRYPDAFVICTPIALKATVNTIPVVVFEILSSSTAAYDRTTKLAEYKSVPSMQQVVLLEQDRVFATVIARTANGWDHSLVSLDGTLAMPEIGIEVPMAELYDGLDFSEAPGPEPIAADA
jgi:Uma2 family endonuclease